MEEIRQRIRNFIENSDLPRSAKQKLTALLAKLNDGHLAELEELFGKDIKYLRLFSDLYERKTAALSNNDQAALNKILEEEKEMLGETFAQEQNSPF